ncbi:MAG TPA: ABC transporter substrate-binding protein, partial [Longimicrobiales bacterium]|nr:ABC transporter substrate-binding protein [Longimicrobiales bacterium]
FSQHAIPVGAIANRSGVPMISPMSSNPATTEGRPYVFRLAFLDADQGEVLARFARERLELDRVGVVTNLTSLYATEVASRFRDHFRELGGDIVEVSYAGGGPEVWRDAFRRVLAQGPDRVLLPLQRSELEDLMTMIEEEDIQVDLLGSDSWDVLTMERFAAARGAYLSHQWMWNVPDERVAPFVNRYRELYGAPPRSTAALTYDAVHLMARAATAAGSLDGMAVRDALADLPSYRGVSGVIEFDEGNSPRRDVVIGRISAGATVFVARVDAR